MTIIDHLSLGVADVPAARVFYGRVLDIFGIRCLAEGDRFAAFGRDRIAFLLLAPLDGGPSSAGNGAHVRTRLGAEILQIVTQRREYQCGLAMLQFICYVVFYVVYTH